MKWLITIVVTVVAAFALLFAFAYLHMRSMRHARIYNDTLRLRVAYREFAKSGVFTNYGDGSRVYICTNVVAVGGSNYSCILATDHPFYGGQGVLAITTDQIFIWLDKTHGAKIIDDSYRPPLFPARY